MNRIASRQLPISQDNPLRTFDNCLTDSQHLIDDAEQGIKRRLDSIAAVDCDVAVQYLLQHFGVRNQTLALADNLFEQPQRIALVRMGRADQVHRDVGVDENHSGASDGGTSVRYPSSISANMPPISLTGYSCRAAARITSSFLPMPPRGSRRRAKSSA